MNTTIYYFSGTGNSLKISKDLTALIPNTTLIRITDVSVREIKEAPEGKIGFVFPVYYYGLPKMVRDFIKNLTIRDNSFVFAVVHFGGSMGAARNQLIRILKGKNIELAAGYGVLMPDNYVLMYEPQSKEEQQKMLSKEKEVMKEIAGEINQGIKRPFTEQGKYFTKLIGPAASGIFHPNRMDQNFWTDTNCNGCGTCEKLCPAGNIVMAENKPQWQHRCELCLSCIQCCPKKSIQYKKGTINRARYRNPDIKLTELYRT